MALQNLLGDIALDSNLQKIAEYLEVIASTIGRTYPDSNGRLQVNVAAGTLPTVTTVTTVSTVSTVTNATQQSGYSTAYDQYCQMMTNASYIRRRITTS
jgi:hypothetical protein